MLWGKGEIELLYYSALKEYEGVNLWLRNSDSDEHTFFINHAVSDRSESNFFLAGYFFILETKH